MVWRRHVAFPERKFRTKRPQLKPCVEMGAAPFRFIEAAGDQIREIADHAPPFRRRLQKVDPAAVDAVVLPVEAAGAN
jgi:hypothetical protein